jgi:phosphinothricin acetyltransferase
MPMTIRLASPDDAEEIQAIYAPYCFTPVSFEAEAPTVEEMRSRITKTLEHHPWLVCEDSGRLLGYVYATRHRERAAYRWSVDTTVYIRQEQHRRGLGRGLYTSLLSVLPVQGYVSAYAGITLPNAASVGLHRALGFQPVGVYQRVGFKLGAWHDVAWFERALQAPVAEPSEPTPLEEVHGSKAWEEALNRGIAVLHGSSR